MLVFDPVLYSLQELQFARDRLGTPPAVALRDPLPAGVSVPTVTRLLRAVYELEELRTHSGVAWVGVPQVQAVIDAYLREHQKWQDMHRRGAPKFPTMYAWDARGRPHKYGVGSDSGQVRTWIDADGARHKFALDLKPADHEPFVADWVKPQEPLPTELIEDLAQGVVTCPLCGYSQSFNSESAASHRMARARIGKHCKSSGVKDPYRHRQFYTHVFGE
jgi:hypothetical protein